MGTRERDRPSLPGRPPFSTLGLMKICPSLPIWILVLASGAGGALPAGEIRVPRDHSTLQAAIDAASSGDLILVAPGRYLGRLRLKPGVILRSEGGDEPGERGLRRAEGTILDGGGEAGDGPGVTMAEGSVLDGFTVTRVGVFDEAEWRRHWDERGEHQDHDAIGPVRAPAIAAAGVNCRVAHNLVHDNADTGIALIGAPDRRHSPAVTGNHCFRNRGGGIGAMGNVAGLIQGNHCFENFYAGIGHEDGAAPWVIGNECHGNIRAGIGISEGARPLVRGNRCHGNRRAGIGIRTGRNTAPVVEENECLDNGMAGIGVEDGAAPVLRGNLCRGNRLAGIGVRSAGPVLALQNRCEDNLAAGIGIESGSEVTAVENTCAGNRLVAIGLQRDSQARLIANTLSRRGGAPPLVAVLEGAEAVLLGNTLSGGGVAAVLVEGEATLLENTVTGEPGGFGILARKRGHAMVRGNRIANYRSETGRQDDAILSVVPEP